MASDEQASDERRLFLQRLSALGLAGALGWEREALAQGERAPGIYRVRGTVRVNGKAARRGMLVKPGDTVETGRGSQAVFVMGKDAFLLRASSRIETGFTAAPAQNAGTADNAFADLLRLTSGKLLSVFSPGARRLETTTATIGIRGTGLYVEVEPRRTYACTCYGEVELQPRDRPEEKETVSTTHHEQPRFIYADGAMPPGSMMQKAPVLNHTDAELTLLESLVGRKPPFEGQGGYPYK